MALSLNDLPAKQQWMVAGALCLALVGIYYMQFWRPNSADAERVRQETLQLRDEVLAVTAIADRLPELEAERAALEARLTVLAHILPEEFETADLLRGVGRLAAQSNLSLRDLEFKDPVPYEFYAESPIELELVGNYHDLARFFDRIGKFARIINIDEVDIKAVEDSATQTVEASVTAMTFLFVEDEGPVEAEEGLLEQ